jgi:DNA polymerase-3 subunit gamma/tau
MAPELVQLPAQRAAEVSDYATRLGAPTIVRAMERLGEMLVEMRHAPDPRLLLEVALVQLTHRAASSEISVVLDRLDRLEQQLAAGGAPPARPAPVDPATGRAALGGRARREAPAGATAGPQSAPPPPSAPPAQAPAAADPAAAPAPGAGDTGDAARAAVQVWSSEVVPSMKSLARAIYAATKVIGERDGCVAVAAPNDAHRGKCLQYQAEVEAAIAKAVGTAVKVVVLVDGAVGRDDDAPAGREATVVRLPTPPPPPADDDVDVDLDDLVDAPPEAVVSPVDRIANAFPGSQLVEE